MSENSNKLTGLISLLNITTSIEDIAPEWDEEQKIKAIYPHLINSQIKVFNNKVEIKNKKEEVKDSDLKPTEFFTATKETIEDKENKKLDSAETIEVYKERMKEGDNFEGLKEEVENLVLDEMELSTELKDIMAKSSASLGLDKKALTKMVKEEVKTMDPNYKEKEDDIVLEGTLEKYKKILGS